MKLVVHGWRATKWRAQEKRRWRKRRMQMSVKTKSTEQIQTDLQGIVKMWPGGIPPEQADSVNALKSELKRRNVMLNADDVSPRENAPGDVNTVSEHQLSKELKVLSDRLARNPKDEEAQTRFADVRFEIRRRAKNGEGKELRDDLTKGTLQGQVVVTTESEVKLREQRDHALLIVDQIIQSQAQFMTDLTDALDVHQTNLTKLMSTLMDDEKAS